CQGLRASSRMAESAPEIPRMRDHEDAGTIVKSQEANRLFVLGNIHSQILPRHSMPYGHYGRTRSGDARRKFTILSEPMTAGFAPFSARCPTPAPAPRPAPIAAPFPPPNNNPSPPPTAPPIAASFPVFLP